MLNPNETLKVLEEYDTKIKELKHELHDKDLLFNAMLDTKNGEIEVLKQSIGKMKQEE